MSKINKEYRILSIQSNVVHGYAGNRIACLILQILGLDVDLINTVNCSNHTSYKHVELQSCNDEQIQKLFDAMILNKFDEQYTHIITGYTYCDSVLIKIKEIINHIRKINPKTIYVCDPVMGDNSKFYVSESVLPIYRDELLSLADIATPNQYEAEFLFGKSIKTEKDGLDALDFLHSKGIKIAIITSIDFENEYFLLASIKSQETSRGFIRFRVDLKKMEFPFVGSGDLFTSLLLGWFIKTNYDFKTSLEKTLSTIYIVLKNTKEFAEKSGKIDTNNLELRLVQSISSIREPELVFEAKNIND